MALGGKALGNGWHDQAARLAGIHTVTTMTSKQPWSSHPAPHAGRDEDAAAGDIDLAQALAEANGRVAALERRLGQETATTQALREHLALLDQQFDIAAQRATELETELAAALDCAAEHGAQTETLQAESQSLRDSLDLAITENTRLSEDLQLSDAACEDARAELTLLQAAAATAAAERGKLSGEVFAANSKRLNETAELKGQLEAMAERAVVAEKLLADARERLAAHIAESGETERSLAKIIAARRDADTLLKQLQDLLCIKQYQLNELEQSRRTADTQLDQLQNSLCVEQRRVNELEQSRHAADSQLDQLQNLLCVEQRRVNELEQSRAELVAATQTLVETCESRTTALATAEDKIKDLTARIAQLEAEAAEPKRRKAVARKARPDRLARPARPAVNRIAAESADRRTAVNWTALAAELAKLVKLKGQSAEPLQIGATSALLAGTITF